MSENMIGVWPVLRASDPDAILRFLVDVLGFTESVVYRDDAGAVHHAELLWPKGGGVMFGSAPDGPDAPSSQQPGSLAAYLVWDEIDALHAKAVAAGATITTEPYDTDYGSREFALSDPEGNRWSFGTYAGHGV